MYKRAGCVAMVMIFLSVAGARAEGDFGIGIIVGEPTGISVKKWISDVHAVDGALAWSFSENDSFQIHADYLIHNFDLFRDEAGDGRLPVYFGLGARVKLKGDNEGNDNGRNDNDTLVGIRVPFGITYLFDNLPADIFAEIVPILDVVPDTEFDLNVAVGMRFYFR